VLHLLNTEAGRARRDLLRTDLVRVGKGRVRALDSHLPRLAAALDASLVYTSPAPCVGCICVAARGLAVAGRWRGAERKWHMASSPNIITSDGWDLGTPALGILESFEVQR
jgi:hypothetical protein